MEKDLYAMKIGEQFWSDAMECNVLRVPGGWLFRSPDPQGDYFASCAFVPWTPKRCVENDVVEIRGNQIRRGNA